MLCGRRFSSTWHFRFFKKLHLKILNLIKRFFGQSGIKLEQALEFNLQHRSVPIFQIDNKDACIIARGSAVAHAERCGAQYNLRNGAFKRGLQVVACVLEEWAKTVCCKV